MPEIRPSGGILLNALRVRCPPTHRLRAFPLPASRSARAALERELGRRVWMGEDRAYATADDAVGSEIRTFGCGEDRGLHLFDLREALAQHCRERGLDVAFGFGGEIRCVSLPGTQVTKDFVIHDLVNLRLVDEGDEDPETILVARYRTRWSLAGSLADPENRRGAVGQTAVRIRSSGPFSGRIVGFEGDTLVLRARGGHEPVPACDYTLRADASFVRRFASSEDLRRLQIASGSLTASGRKNRYAVKDRFLGSAKTLSRLGSGFSLAGGGSAALDSEWAEVRVEEVS